MELLIGQLLSAVIQVMFFSFLPLLLWIFRGRKKEGFFSWIGLKSISNNDRKKVLFFSSITLFVFIVLSVYLLFLLKDIQLATSEFDGIGITALPAAIVYSFIKTGLSEEILFRGFILKGLLNKMNFTLANAIQSILFGLLHGVMFFNFVNPIITFIIIALTGAIGWFMGYINEKKANGSILPSWIIHGLSNLFASMVAMFSIL
ncbi:MAG: CPBP family intramembrane glutamic endopeptidase [Lachnospiraceae bacterium]